MNILVCTDGSTGSLAILPHAARLARALGARIVLSRVLDPRVDAGDTVTPRLEDAVARVKDEWSDWLRQTLAREGIEGEVLIPEREWGKEIADAISDAAEETSAAIVAVSSRGAGAIRHALFGSVALGIISRADLPVLTLAGSHPTKAGAGTYHIVITSDGSPDSRSIFGGLENLLVPGKTRVTLLEVVTMKAQETEAEAQARALPYLESLRSRIPGGVEVAIVAKAAPASSRVDSVIVQAAKEFGADAIASSTHGHSARRHLVAGSTALGMVEKAGMPVILVKSQPVD